MFSSSRNKFPSLHVLNSERYQNLSKEEKENKQEYRRKRYKTLSEGEKQRLAEFIKKYYRMRKIALFQKIMG